MASNNPLLEIIAPLLQQVDKLRKKNQIAVDDDFRQRIEASFNQLEKEGYSQQLKGDQIADTRYAVAAYIDELVLLSDWSGRDDWRGEPLQLKFFGEHLAGEGFFKRLSDIRQKGQEYLNVLEIYYVCLQLGFQGMYRVRGVEQLMALMVDLRNQIENARGVVDRQLSAGIDKQIASARHFSQRIPFWVIAAVTAVILVLIYFGYSLVINHQANKSVKKLISLEQQFELNDAHATLRRE